MKIGYKVGLIFIIILLIIFSTIATSYAMWTAVVTQSDENTIVAGCLEILFNDLDVNEQSTSINLLNTYPISDNMGLRLKPYAVQIRNNCSIAASYKLILSDLMTNTLDISNIKYSLNHNGVIYGPSRIDNITPYSMDNSIQSIIENEKNVELKNSYVLASGVLNPTETETYELKLWVKEEATDVMDQEFGAVVSYETYATNPHS